MSATYIYQHTSGYIFRYCIPPDIQPLIKNKLQEVTSKTHRIVPMAVSPAITPSRPSGAGPKLSDVLGRYVADAKKAKQWSPKTEQEVISCTELFIQAIGDRQVHTIEKASVRGYKETLLRLPSNLRKLPEYRDKTNPRDPDWITTFNCL